MSFPEVDGVSRSDVQEQVAAGLTGYYMRTDSGVKFDKDKAVDLERVPGKPNFARSVSIVRMGKHVAQLFVIVFRRGDGTGDESARKLEDIRNTGQYPRKELIVPRDKSAMQAEAHLTIATFREDGTPVPFAGLLDLVGLDQDALVRLGSLGQHPTEFNWHMANGRPLAEPEVTYTTWHRGGHSFGDPHAVYNSTLLQVCGFIGVPSGESTAILNALGARMPVDVS